jgi:hypothetical protein
VPVHVCLRRRVWLFVCRVSGLGFRRSSGLPVVRSSHVWSHGHSAHDTAVRGRLCTAAERFPISRTSTASPSPPAAPRPLGRAGIQAVLFPLYLEPNPRKRNTLKHTPHSQPLQQQPQQHPTPVPHPQARAPAGSRHRTVIHPLTVLQPPSVSRKEGPAESEGAQPPCIPCGLWVPVPVLLFFHFLTGTAALPQQPSYPSEAHGAAAHADLGSGRSSTAAPTDRSPALAPPSDDSRTTMTARTNPGRAGGARLASRTPGARRRAAPASISWIN